LTSAGSIDVLSKRPLQDVLLLVMLSQLSGSIAPSNSHHLERRRRNEGHRIDSPNKFLASTPLLPLSQLLASSRRNQRAIFHRIAPNWIQVVINN